MDDNLLKLVIEHQEFVRRAAEAEEDLDIIRSIIADEIKNGGTYMNVTAIMRVLGMRRPDGQN